MKKLFTLFIFAMVIQTGFSQTKAEIDVANAVETLRKAMVDADKNVLDKIATTELSYGHSSGKVEDKTAFVEALTSAKSDFVKIDLTEQTIKMAGKTAIVRHKLAGDIKDGGKPASVKLLILQIWQKQGAGWKLLARQAVRQP